MMSASTYVETTQRMSTSAPTSVNVIDSVCPGSETMSVCFLPASEVTVKPVLVQDVFMCVTWSVFSGRRFCTGVFFGGVCFVSVGAVQKRDRCLRPTLILQGLNSYGDGEWMSHPFIFESTSDLDPKRAKWAKIFSFFFTFWPLLRKSQRLKTKAEFINVWIIALNSCFLPHLKLFSYTDHRLSSVFRQNRWHSAAVSCKDRRTLFSCCWGAHARGDFLQIDF